MPMTSAERFAPYARYPSLEDKSVFVSGGSSGIGAVMVAHFADQGAKVAFVGRNERSGADVVNACSGAMHGPVFLRCDVTDTPALQGAIAAAGEAHGAVQVLINNAADDARHWTRDVTPASWDAMIAINFKHYFFAAQAVAPAMRAAKSGSIVNIGSISWMLKAAELSVYAACNAAIMGLTRSHAAEFGADGVRVNCIAPGWTMTQKQIDTWLTPEGEAEIARGQLIKDKVQPGDIARLALFLSAEDSRMITAQHYVVDGGWA